MHIKTALFRFNIKALEPIILPSYKGSTFRGGFGNAFKRVVCAIKNKDCPDCLLKEKCIYSYVFETPPPPDTKIMRKYTAAPHPFVIEPPLEKRRGYKTGDEINFNLTLIGRAIDYLPYFIYTFDELGKIGLGKGRGKYELKEVISQDSEVREAVSSQDSEVESKRQVECRSVIPAKAGIQGRIIYDSVTKTLKSFQPSALNLEFGILNPGKAAPGRLTLDFLTPTRIIYDGHLTLDLEFHMLVRQLLRRISLLYYFHCNGDPSAWDFKGLIEKAKEVKVARRELRWYDWERYSARQDERLKMGGFVGKITFEGNIEQFMPLINAGEILHVGKGTSFGLGKYVLNLES